MGGREVGQGNLLENVRKLGVIRGLPADVPERLAVLEELKPDLAAGRERVGQAVELEEDGQRLPLDRKSVV